MMSGLIEQLGGYEKAKEMYIAQLKAGLAPYGYEEALLQYRRENNIFEVGDSVMYEGKLYEIKYIYHSEKARITDGFQGRNIYDFPKGIKHATLEELKAGRRL